MMDPSRTRISQKVRGHGSILQDL
ncbi:unnamed protein product [Victoria cruziana]